MTNGELDVKDLAHKPKEIVLTDLRQWERDMVISEFDVPPERLGILGNNNRATAVGCGSRVNAMLAALRARVTIGT
jgi:hypothetical protein